MPQLANLKAAIDDGKTAKHLMWRSILHHLIRKENGYYGRQSEGYTNEIDIVVVPVVTSFYPTWEQLIDSFQGRYADDEWQLCDDKFEDYLPPEREYPQNSPSEAHSETMEHATVREDISTREPL